jgi:hypothetical protein
MHALAMLNGNYDNPVMPGSRIGAVSVLGLAFVLGACSEMPEPKNPDRAVEQHIEEVKNSLPPGCFVRDALSIPLYRGDGIRQPWMDRMRTLQVKMVMYEVRGFWLVYFGRPNPKVTRRMYFSKYCGPGSQITDAAWLRRIRDSGLESELEAVAISRADKPRPALDPLPFWCKGCYTEVFFTDDEWLLNVPIRLSAWAETVTSLDQAAAAGDSISVSNLLSAGNITKSQLDEALLYAVDFTPLDNTQVVRLLVKAGASPSANWRQDSLEALKRAEEQDSTKK